MNGRAMYKQFDEEDYYIKKEPSEFIQKLLIYYWVLERNNYMKENILRSR